MNIFKKKIVFWYLIILVECFLVAWTYQLNLRNSTLQLYEIYETTFGSFILIAIIFPIFSGIILNQISNQMNYSKILCFRGRVNWFQFIVKQNFKTSFLFVMILLFPLTIMDVIMTKRLNIVYFVLNFSMYVITFLIVTFILIGIKLRFNSDALALMSALIVEFFPYFLTKIMFGGRNITISDIINSYYAFNDGKYYWFIQGGNCLTVFAILIVGIVILRKFVKEMDILWRAM